MKIEATTTSSSGVDSAQAMRDEMRADLNIGGEPGLGLGKVDASARAVSEAGGFAAVIEKTAMVASAKAREAAEKAEALAAGRIDDLHGTMISMKEADISMKLVGSVRDKLMDAFHELWRINV